MIRATGLVFILCVSVSAFAGDKEFSIYAGGGVSAGKTSLVGANSTASSSKFSDNGYFLEGGMNVPMSGDVGWALGGEIGKSTLVNTLKSETYMENAQLDYYAVKLGLYIRQFGFGAGYRHNDLTVKSISLSSNQYLENNYKGFLPFAYGNFSVEFKGRYRAAVEGQYVTGSLKNSTSGTVKFNEMTVGLRVFLMFE